jgi:hypothetical protein
MEGRGAVESLGSAELRGTMDGPRMADGSAAKNSHQAVGVTRDSVQAAEGAAARHTSEQDDDILFDLPGSHLTYEPLRY